MEPHQFRSARLSAKAEAQMAKNEPESWQLATPPLTPVAVAAVGVEKTVDVTSDEQREHRSKLISNFLGPSRKRTRAGLAKAENDSAHLPSPKLETGEETKVANVLVSKTPRRRKDNHRAVELQQKAQQSGIPGHREPRLKYLSYGLSPGETPFPEHEHPTPDECEEVFRLLSQAHGDRIKPDVIPPPNPKVAGCGETPCILDGLIRTYVSGATTMDNANHAIDGMGQAFGLIRSKGALGEGSVDYKAVHQADVDVLFEAIKSGGLGERKSRTIKEILDMIHEECQEWQNTKESNPSLAFARGAQTADEVWNLEYLRHLDVPDVFVHLLEYPGIGVKTVACVCLFTLQHPVFAVDTHCWRLCKGLGWVPPHANENRTFAHCDVKIPDHLKYRLHQLMIVHGKSCSRCKAGRTKKSKGWEDGCVLDHLLNREAMRNGKKGHVPRKRKSTEDEDGAEDGASDVEDTELPVQGI